LNARCSRRSSARSLSILLEIRVPEATIGCPAFGTYQLAC